MFDRIVTNNIYKTERYGIYKTEMVRYFPQMLLWTDF